MPERRARQSVRLSTARMTLQRQSIALIDSGRAEKIETFFYNNGMEVALMIIYIALNVVFGAHAAYTFLPASGYEQENPYLRVTLPIARLGGRLVTINSFLLLLTASKWTWTWIRENLVPLLQLSFPIDHVMPKYHRIIALNIIFNGVVVHTLPQIVNYASGALHFGIPGSDLVWTWGAGFATKQLLVTGILLAIIFSVFYVTTLEAVRRRKNTFGVFWFFHVGGIVLVFPLLIIHGTQKGYPILLYVIAFPIAVYCFDLCMRGSKTIPTRIVKWTAFGEDKSDGITELIVECPSSFNYTPGQYAELKYNPISEVAWHPFTIASSPNDEPWEDPINPGYEGATKKIVFYIKAVGNWTTDLFTSAKTFHIRESRHDTEIMIRGPHGAPAMNYFEYTHLIAIGSGVGVTPLLSIWKYLVNSIKRDAEIKELDANDSIAEMNEYVKKIDQNVDHSDEIDDDVELSSFYLTAVYTEYILHSLTVSVCLLGLCSFYNSIGIILNLFYPTGMFTYVWFIIFSSIVLLFYIATFFSSTIALGPIEYVTKVVFWIDLALIATSAWELYSSCSELSKRQQMSLDSMGQSDFDQLQKINLAWTSCEIILQAIRVFNIFYVALKPNLTHEEKMQQKEERKKQTNAKHVKFVHGVFINRTYKGMKFAAKSLLPPTEGSISQFFAMDLYGTREKTKPEYEYSEDDDEKDKLVPRYFKPGRPDWKRIFANALRRAHKSNPAGERVGVFFCGAPAIAHDLQLFATEVTAQHQTTMAHFEGKRCNCKVIVHAENF